MKALPGQVTIVIVTHNRPDLLKQLLVSIAALEAPPAGVIVVDNASGPETAEVIRAAREAGGCELACLRLETNAGGAGGFAAGVQEAMRRGAEWLWLMDDDVALIPEGFAALLEWTERFRCFHGRRYDHDGTPFFCEQRISERLGVQVPIVPKPFATAAFFLTNWACFEGLLIHRDIVERIGIPDARFFLVWDDAIYGWLASKITEVAFVDVFALQRTRQLKQVSLGLRHLSASSDLSRFHAMRNRALIREYFQAGGVFRPLPFAFGTFLVFAKELVRMLFVERSLKGLGSLLRGYRAYRAGLKDPSRLARSR